jgi:hypothetical protein
VSGARDAGRRLAAALAGAALLLALGAPLHQHHGAASASAPTVSAAAPDAGLHAGADCPACQSSGRVRASLAPAGLAILVRALPALRLAAHGAPVSAADASRPPTPPRGPPLATA